MPILIPNTTKYPNVGGMRVTPGLMQMSISGVGVTVDVSAFTVSPRTRALAISPEDRDLTESPRARSLSITIPDRPVE